MAQIIRLLPPFGPDNGAVTTSQKGRLRDLQDMERHRERGAGGLRGPRAASGSPVGDGRPCHMGVTVHSPRLVPLRNEDRVVGLLAELFGDVKALPAPGPVGDRLR